MAKRIANKAAATWSTAGDWWLIDETSYINIETGTTVSSTVLQYSDNFTVTADDYESLLLKLNSRVASPSGTFTCYLETGGVPVAGTSVTINAADLPAGTNSGEYANSIGWIQFKWAAPVTLAAATNYRIVFSSSVVSTVTLWRGATATALSRALVRTTTGAPAAGDDFWICGQKTAAGAMTNVVVTYDSTASTDYGSGVVSDVTPAMVICDGGELTFANTAATDYLLVMSGRIRVYLGGKFYMGKSGAVIPVGGSAELRFDSVANADMGLYVIGTFECHGDCAFVSYTRQTADIAASGTSLTVQDTTGWLAGDTLIITTTTATASQTEERIISTVNSGTNVTLTVGVTNAHSGSVSGVYDTRAYVINTRRNVKITGATSLLQGYAHFAGPSAVVLRKMMFTRLGSGNGSGTSSRRGVDVNTQSGSFDAEMCAFYSMEVATSIVQVIATTGTGLIRFADCYAYRVYSSALTITATTSTNWTIENFIACNNISGTLITLNDLSGTVDGLISIGAATVGIAVSEGNTLGFEGPIGTFQNVVVKAANGTGGLYIYGRISGTMTNIEASRNTTTSTNTAGIMLGTISGDLILDGVLVYGNTSRGISYANGEVLLKNTNIQPGTTIVQTTGINVANTPNAAGGSGNGNLFIESATIGTDANHSSGDVFIVATSYTHLHMTDCDLGSTVEVTGVLGLGKAGCVNSLKHDGVSGDHKAAKQNGRNAGWTLETDTTIFATASPSVRMYPGNASGKLESMPMLAAVASGNTLTVSVKVRESVVGDGADYNGARPRLIVKRNVLAGITSDTVLDTATISSEGAFETLTGTTPAVAEDCVLEFVVDCDGTTGWINVDEFECVAEDPNGTEYWSHYTHGPFSIGMPAGGGGSSGIQRHPGMSGGFSA